MINEKKYFHLSDKGFFIIKGVDKIKFLQGLTSNDLNKVKSKKIIYSSILTPQGKILFDIFISQRGQDFLVECSRKNLSELTEKLEMYKLNSKVSIEIEQNLKSFLINQSHIENLLGRSKDEDLFYCEDPRFEKKLLKIYCVNKIFKEIKQELSLTSLTNEEYENIKLQNTILDCDIESIKSKSTLLELRFDELNAIDWDKGCYMGQEITARTKYRGLLKKKIFGVRIQGEIKEKFIFSGNENIGEILSFNKKLGIAILKIKDANHCMNNNNKMKCGEAELTPFIPSWAK